MKLKITNINWCVEEEDVIDLFEDEPTQKEINDEIKKIKKSLPKTATVEVDDEEEIADALSDEYGWLVESFDYKKC